MSTFCSIISCSKEQDTIDGTSTSCSASCESHTAVRIGISSCKILGTSITFSGTGRRVEKAHDVLQLVDHLRRRIVEKRHRRDCIDSLLLGAPQILLLRPDASEAVRPRPGGRHIFDVQGKVLGACRLGVGCSGTWPCSTARSHFPLLAFICPPWGGVVLVRGQEHLQRELLVPPVQPKMALTAPPRCTAFMIAMQRHVDNWLQQKITQKRQHKPVEPCVVVVEWLIILKEELLSEKLA